MKPLCEHTARVGCRVHLGRHEQQQADAAAAGSSIMASFGFGAQNTPLMGTVAGFRTRAGGEYGQCTDLMKGGQALVKWEDGAGGMYNIGAGGRYDLCEGNKLVDLAVKLSALQPNSGMHVYNSNPTTYPLLTLFLFSSSKTMFSIRHRRFRSFIRQRRFPFFDSPHTFFLFDESKTICF